MFLIIVSDQLAVLVSLSSILLRLDALKELLLRLADQVHVVLVVHVLVIRFVLEKQTNKSKPIYSVPNVDSESEALRGD